MSSNHRKASPIGRVTHERAVLRLVQGPGVVPTAANATAPRAQRANAADPTVVETVAGNRSIADVLAERGRLSEAECRSIGSRIATALEDTLDPSDDIVGVALLVAQCATGVLIDPTAEWSALALAQLGCSTELAHDLAAVLADPSDPRRVALLLGSPDDRLLTPAGVRSGSDPTPTIDFEPTAISGLDPLPSTTESFNQPATPVGWQARIQQTFNDWLRLCRKKQSELLGYLRGRGG